MSEFLKKFDFKKEPLKITYFDKEPLKLSNELIFFHNKNKFRKYLNPLQYLIKSYTKVPLQVAGIRDSYLKEEFTNKFLIVLLSNSETIKKTNEIIEAHSDIELNTGCFYMEVKEDSMLLISKDMEALTQGINIMETVLKQVMENYVQRKKFDDYIKICPFELLDCVKSV